MSYRTLTDEANLRWFDQLAALPTAAARRLVEQKTRSQIINWLQWNDPNGSYTDALMVKEGWDPMTKEEAVTVMMAAIEDLR